MLHDDAAVAYQYLLERYPEDQIVVYGRSIGSGIATYLAKTHRARCSNTLYGPICGSAMWHAQSICSMVQATISLLTAQASGLPRWSGLSTS
jgi:pimeloyl-ACP methyl ester carboxylesterase